MLALPIFLKSISIIITIKISYISILLRTDLIHLVTAYLKTTGSEIGTTQYPRRNLSESTSNFGFSTPLNNGLSRNTNSKSATLPISINEPVVFQERSSDEIGSAIKENARNPCRDITASSISPKIVKRRQWKLEEDKLLIETLLQVTNLMADEIGKKVIKDSAETLTGLFNRQLSSITSRWCCYLQPIILSQALGERHRPVIAEVYSFLIYLKVMKIEEINWTQMVTKWPSQNEMSIKSMVQQANHTKKLPQHEPLHKKLKVLLPFKDKPIPTQEHQFNIEITETYNNAIKARHVPKAKKSLPLRNYTTNPINSPSPVVQNQYHGKFTSPFSQANAKRHLVKTTKSTEFSELNLSKRLQSTPKKKLQIAAVKNSSSSARKSIDKDTFGNGACNDRKGSWTLEEDKRLIEMIFKIEPNLDASKIDEQIAEKIFQQIKVSLKRPVSSITRRWLVSLQPILLSSMYGKLNVPITSAIFSYLISQKVRSFYDINWTTLLKIWPFQTEKSLKVIVQRAVNDPKVTEKEILFEKLILLLPFYTNKTLTPLKKSYNESIVSYYNNIKTKKRQSEYRIFSA